MLTSLEIRVINVTFVFEVDEPQNLPRYLFSSIRGAWGAALKGISCVRRRRKNCLECPFHWDCAYGYLFETPRPEESDRMKLYPYIPHPFVFYPPYPPPYKSPLEVGFTLVGRGTEFFPHAVLAMEVMGKRGLGPKRIPLRLVSVKDKKRELYGKGEILSPSFYPEFQIREAAKIEVIFITPTRLKFNEKIVKFDNLEFHILLRNLLRRISSLCYFHESKDLKVDFRGMIEAAHKVKIQRKDLKQVSFKRRSSRSGQVFVLSGFTGKVVFMGELTPFTPFIELGCLVHVGKSTSFGMGKYLWMALE